MKKALLLVVIIWFLLSSASSFACNLCVELEKRGFSPQVINQAISKHFGTGLKVNGKGKPFYYANGIPFESAIGKDGRDYSVTATKQLRGIAFDGFISGQPVKIFVADGINYVGIKTERSVPQPKKNDGPPQAVANQIATKVPIILTEKSAALNYSDEVIQVPPDIEGR